MNEQVDLTKGGVATVMIGHNGFIQEYANHPQVRFIDCKEVSNDLLEPTFPNTTRVVILTEGVPAYHYTWVTSYARRKGIPFLIRKSNDAIYQALKGFFPTNDKPVTQEEARESESKGKLNVLIPLIDFSKSNAENAKVLLKYATDKGIKSTLGSLAQLVSNQRKKTGHGAIVQSARSKLDVSVEILDKMIEDLTAMRDFIINTTEENRLLKMKLEKINKAME